MSSFCVKGKPRSWAGEQGISVDLLSYRVASGGVVFFSLAEIQQSTIVSQCVVFQGESYNLRCSICIDTSSCCRRQ